MDPPHDVWYRGQTIGAEDPGDARRICDVFSFVEPEPGDLAWGNARLIETSPELLDALKDLLESHLLLTRGNPLCYEERRLREEKAACAIAKATRLTP
jgi:hypothetical protein